MKRETILVFGVVIILLASFVIAFSDLSLTGKSISNLEKSYTKAICNADNECVDVLIVCDGKRVKSLEPVSDVVKFDEDWKDFRDKEGFC